MTTKTIKTKMTSIIAITFVATLMLVPTGMNTNVFAADPDPQTHNKVMKIRAQVLELPELNSLSPEDLEKLQITLLNKIVMEQSALIKQLQYQITSLDMKVRSLDTTSSQHDTRLTALESSKIPVYYTNNGTIETVPALANSWTAIASCNEGDKAIYGSWNINGYFNGVNGIHISNTIPIIDGNSWFFRMNNNANVEVEFEPTVLCVHYLK